MSFESTGVSQETAVEKKAERNSTTKPYGMVPQMNTVVGLLIGSWVVFSLYYYNNFYPMKYENELQTFRRRKPENPKVSRYKGTEDYLINTTGCYIPNYIKKLHFVEARTQKVNCGERAVFIERVENNNIKFFINDTLLRKQSDNQKYECCYQYVKRSTVAGHEDNQVTYLKCTRFKSGAISELKEEVIKVSCTTIEKTKKKKFYEDSYMILKQIITKDRGVSNATHWNVLVVGMDTMSRARMLSAMPETARYFDQHGWLDYKGYQKVGFNTYPNLMAFLTGRNMSTVYRKCAKGMSSCNDDIIWKKFQNSGYITAYGEDYHRLPDTFTPYHGFKVLPTNHYMRPFFLTGETAKGNLICTHKLPSAIHALQYATQFVNSYKNDKFFGMFWLNSYSHNLNNVPTLLDEDMRNFFHKLNKTGVFDNTFIFFLGDHGIRFGNMRLPMESYYEERLPMYFMWAPLEFRKKYKQAYYNLQLNQNRLTTPYDLHETFRSILQLSSASDIGEQSEACPECSSLFEEKSEDRTCDIAKVNEKWCSCLNLIKVDKRESRVSRSVNLAVSHIKNVSNAVNTKKCTKCHEFKLKKVLRAHSQVDFIHNTTNYVIAVQMSPGDVAYEVNIQENNDDFHIIEPTETISMYNTRGNCVVHPNDRAYCVCEQLKRCKKN